jgi:hypothetical protein
MSMPRRSASTGAGSSDASTIRAVLRPACGLIPLFESPREDSRVDRLVGGAAREEKPVLGFDVGQGGSSTRAWQLREQVGQDWRQQEFVIAEHKVGVAGSLAQRVARDGKYASQVEPVEQRHEGRRHVGVARPPSRARSGRDRPQRLVARLGHGDVVPAATDSAGCASKNPPRRRSHLQVDVSELSSVCSSHPEKGMS